MLKKVLKHHPPIDHVDCTVLPYIKGTTDKIGNLLKKYNMKTIFKTINKIKQMNTPVKS